MGEYIKLEKGLYRWYDDNGEPGTIKMSFKHRGQRVNRTTGKVTIEEARVVMDKTKAQIDIDLGAVVNRAIFEGPIRLSEALTVYYEHKWKGTEHGEESLTRVQYIMELIGDMQCQDITTKTVRNLRKALLAEDISHNSKERHRRPTTVNRYITALKSIMLDLHRQGYISKLPEWDMVSEKEYRRDRLVSADEMESMIEFLSRPITKGGIAAEKPNPKATAKRQGVAKMLRVLWKTGMRTGEATKITFGRHIKMDRRVIMITADIAKGKSIRTLPMTTEVYDIMKEVTPAPDGRAFPFSTSYVSKLWRLGREHMGIKDPNFVPHAIRHTVATGMLERGVPVVKVQSLLGHEDVATTMIYSLNS